MQTFYLSYERRRRENFGHLAREDWSETPLVKSRFGLEGGGGSNMELN